MHDHVHDHGHHHTHDHPHAEAAAMSPEEAIALLDDIGGKARAYEIQSWRRRGCICNEIKTYDKDLGAWVH